MKIDLNFWESLVVVISVIFGMVCPEYAGKLTLGIVGMIFFKVQRFCEKMWK